MSGLLDEDQPHKFWQPQSSVFGGSTKRLQEEGYIYTNYHSFSTTIEVKITVGEEAEALHGKVYLN